MVWPVMSDTFYRRAELMQTLELPTISETKEQLGLPLAAITFDECHEELQRDAGLAPPLEGAGDVLWVSPSDLLIGKVCLKPPLTQKHIQALTHQGIIEIGSRIEEKFLNEMRLEKAQALAELEEYLLRTFIQQKEKLILQIREEEMIKYMEQIENIRSHFEKEIQELIFTFGDELRLREDMAKINLDETNEFWAMKLHKEIKRVVLTLTDEFLAKLRAQEAVLTNIFKKQIDNMEMQKKCAMDFERIKCKENLMQLRHALECQNVANMMYILCKERRKCRTEKDKIIRNYKQQIKKLKTQITDQSKTIRHLRAIKAKKIRQLKVREICLTEILRQYQKLIYYALRATPTQAEFLLNVHRMMRFELQDCIPPAPPKRPAYAMPLQIEALPEPSFQSLEEEGFVEEEEQLPEESDVLPAFYFNDRMYVREDFRDMFDNGVPVERQNPLWNQDVDELMKIFKCMVGENRASPQNLSELKDGASQVHFPEEIDGEIDILTSNTPSPVSLPGRSSDPPPVAAPACLSEGTASVTMEDAGNVLKPAGHVASRIQLARDSIILAITTLERKSLLEVVKTNIASVLGQLQDDYKEQDDSKGDQIEESITTASTGSIQSRDKKEETSKIVLANDSLDVIRSNSKVPIVEEKTPMDKVALLRSRKVKKRMVKIKPAKEHRHQKGTCKVAGTRKLTGQNLGPQEFTDRRVRSLVNLMKDNPSLLRLFTGCSR